MSAAQNVMASEPQQVQWHYVCETNDLVTNSGVCALVDSQQVAIFSLKINGETQVFAISNYDPIGKANVLYRGLLFDRRCACCCFASIQRALLFRNRAV